MYLTKTSFSPRYGNEFYTFDIVGHVLRSKDCCNVYSIPYIEYVIEVRRGTQSYLIYKRFNEFYNMINDFLKLYHNKKLKFTLPEKEWLSMIFGSQVSNSFVTKRILELFECLDSIYMVPTDDEDINFLMLTFLNLH